MATEKSYFLADALSKDLIVKAYPPVELLLPRHFSGNIQRKPDRTERLTSCVEGKKMWGSPGGGQRD